MAYDANKLKSQALRRLLDHDPDSTSEVVATLNPAASEKCIAISALGGLKSLLVGLFHSVGTGAVQTFRIFVADNAAGTTNAVNVASHALGSVPDAVGDHVWLEVTQEQIKAASATALYVGVKVQLATGTDECVIAIEAHGAHNQNGLTADYVS